MCTVMYLHISFQKSLIGMISGCHTGTGVTVLNIEDLVCIESISVVFSACLHALASMGDLLIVVLLSSSFFNCMAINEVFVLAVILMFIRRFFVVRTV